MIKSGEMRATIGMLAACSLALAGCGDQRAHTVCTGGTDGPVVAGAVLFELDDYGAGNQCDGADVADPTVAPVTSHTFAAGAPISAALPPGAHTLVLRAFADSAGDTEIGSGCVDVNVSAGGDFCFDLSLTPTLDDGGDARDLAGGGGGGGGDDGGCAVTHSDGLGDTFVDCVALGTQNTTQAHKAAGAWDATGTTDALAKSYSDNKGSLLYICDQSTARNACACWTWNGTGQYAGAGRALATAGKPTQCFIPFNGTYPAWN
jgi:hypothetical protein